jgi:threonine 3-dehydrogenase
MVTGHEFVGEVADVGSAVTEYRRGQRVSGEGHIVCGHCRNCRAGRGHLCRNTKGVGVNRPGAFAEYVAIPQHNVVPIPDDIPDEVAAIFDPLGNAVHTALSFDLVGEDVLVTGAGPIGCMSVAVARHAGARHIVVTDLEPNRLELARRMGATLAVHPRERDLADVQGELGMTEGFDVMFEMSGNADALRAGMGQMAQGGRVGMLGIPTSGFELDLDPVIFNMLTLKGIYGREMYETWYQMSVMIDSGLDVSPVITDRFAYTAYDEAFAIAGSGGSGKVLLDWKGH